MNVAIQHPGNPPSPLRGWIVAQYTQYRGKRLGPYYVRCWKENGKIKKQYVKPADLHRVRAACQENRDRRRRGTQIAADFSRTVANINWLWRMSNRAKRACLRREDYDHIARIDEHGIDIPGRPKLRSPKLQRHTPNNQHPSSERSFMYPSSANSRNHRTSLRPDTIRSLKKMIDGVVQSKFACETVEEKWQRWRDQHAKHSPPRPLPKVDVRLCVPLDYIDDIAAKLSGRLDESIASNKGVPNWRKL